MLKADEINTLRDTATELTQPIIDYLLQDLAQRIAEAGQLTATTQYEVWRLQQLGISQRETKKQLKKLLSLSKNYPNVPVSAIIGETGGCFHGRLEKRRTA